MAEEKKAPSKASEPKKEPAKKPAAPKAEKPESKPAEKPAKKAPAKTLNRLEKKYKEEVVPALMKKFNYSSVMEAPRFEKIVINMGVGEATQNDKALEDAVNELTAIAGQRPVTTKAKKSVANFKVREGQLIGCKVTLRGDRMYEFFDKLVSISLPRVRDFRGVSRNAFDGRGNYTLGVREQLIFPEIDYDKVTKTRGMDVVVVTTAKTDEEGLFFLEAMGMPFKK